MRWRRLAIWLGFLFPSCIVTGQASAGLERVERARPISLSPDVPVATYDFDIQINPSKHQLAGQGTIVLPALATDRETVELELREEFTLLAVTIESGAAPAAAAKLSRAKRDDQVIWSVLPGRRLRAGERIRLHLSYAGGHAEAGRFLYIGPEVNFANASRESWLPRPVGLSVMGNLRFSVPAGLTVAAMGSRTSTTGQERKGKFYFTSRVPGEPWFAAGHYTVLERPGPFPAAVYLLKPRPGMDAYVDGCTRIIEVLSQQFGGYPFSTFSLVELPAEITAKAGGFNALGGPGAILTHGGAFDEPFNLAYFGHEIGHQWWGNVITRDPSDGRGDYMMDEAMADLGSLFAVEAIEGAAAGEQYRRIGYLGFNPDSYSGLGYLKVAAAGVDIPLSALPDSDLSFRLARSKGGRVWYALAQEIARDKFPSVIQTVVRKHAFQPVTWTAFLASINEAAGRDLNWFYAENFDRIGAPDWKIDWRSVDAKQTELTVTQARPYGGRVPATIMTSGGTVRNELSLNGPRTTKTLQIGSVISATLDPHFTRLNWEPEYKAEATALAGYTRGRLAETNAEKIAILKGALSNIPKPDRYAARYQINSLIGTLLAVDKKPAQARTYLEAAISDPNALADRLPLTFLRLAQVAKSLKDQPLLERTVRSAIDADALVGNRTGAGAQAGELLEQRHP